MRLFLSIIIFVVALVSSANAATAPIKVLLIDGQNNHQWATTTPLLKKISEDTGRFTVDVTTTPAAPPPPRASRKTPRPRKKPRTKPPLRNTPLPSQPTNPPREVSRRTLWTPDDFPLWPPRLQRRAGLPGQDRRGPLGVPASRQQAHRSLRPAPVSPAGWSTDDWPWIGGDTNDDGIGESVGIDVPYLKPLLPPQPINPAEPSDEFSTTTLGGQWAWNQDPDDAQWSLTARPGWLGLTARALHTHGGVSQSGRIKVNYHADHLLFAANTLVQSPCGVVSGLVTRIDTVRLSDDQRAGLCTLSADYTWIGVVRRRS